MCNFISQNQFFLPLAVRYFRGALLVFLLPRTGHADDRGVHDPASTFIPSPCSTSRPWRTALAPGRSSAAGDGTSTTGWHQASTHAQVDPHEAAQAGAVVERFLARLVGQVESVLHEQHAKHPLKPHWWDSHFLRWGNKAPDHGMILVTALRNMWHLAGRRSCWKPLAAMARVCSFMPPSTHPPVSRQTSFSVAFGRSTSTAARKSMDITGYRIAGLRHSSRCSVAR